jgi:succinoglycan biosynthesis protein ExoL
MLLEAGYDVHAYAFHRGYYEENTFPESVTVASLGTVESGNYLSRLPKLMRAMLRVRACERRQSKSPSLIYAFGLDMAVVGAYALQRSIPLVYEIGDVQNPLPHRTLTSMIFGKVEAKIIARCRMLVVTSAGFASDYFSLVAPGSARKTLVIENKLARDVAVQYPRPSRPQVPTKPIRIGYIGAFKYENCLRPLLDAVAQRSGDFELHCHGDGELKSQISMYASRHDNIFYHGSFASNRDLQRIYQSVHVSYVVYDTSDPNVRMALPNKLYDGPYFGVPLVVAENTLLAARVRQYGIGLAVDPQSRDFAAHLLDALTVERIAELSAATLRLGSPHLVECYEDIVPTLKECGKLDIG